MVHIQLFLFISSHFSISGGELMINVHSKSPSILAAVCSVLFPANTSFRSSHFPGSIAGSENDTLLTCASEISTLCFNCGFPSTTLNSLSSTSVLFPMLLQLLCSSYPKQDFPVLILYPTSFHIWWTCLQFSPSSMWCHNQAYLLFPLLNSNGTFPHNSDSYFQLNAIHLTHTMWFPHRLDYYIAEHLHWVCKGCHEFPVASFFNSSSSSDISIFGF